jgi:DNA adenine methylase
LSRLVAFPYYGGKTVHLGWLLPKLPYTEIYIEPFGGSAAVLLNREASTYEVYNDLSSNVSNFFLTLRNDFDELLTRIQRTMYAKSEFDIAVEFLSQPREILEEDRVEWARSFFTRIRQSFMASGKQWVLGQKGSANMNSWWQGIDSLQYVYERFRDVHIENCDGIDLVAKFSRKDAFIYQDPPYVLSSRSGGESYEIEMPDELHIKLAEVNIKSEALIAISGYPTPLYEELYESQDWYIFDHTYSLPNNNLRTERIWCNYDPFEVRQVDQTAITEFFKVYSNER